MKKLLFLSMICLLFAVFTAGCSGTDGKEESKAQEISETETVLHTEMTESAQTSTQEMEPESETETVPPVSVETILEESSFQFADLKGYEFDFSSGVGGWYTSMTIEEDGSFSGIYTDSDMGDRDDLYPQGTVYRCDFHGVFAPLEKVDKDTYKTSVESISYERTVGEEEIRDEMRFIYSDAYGIYNAKEVYIYLEGTQVSKLSDTVVGWIEGALYDYEANVRSDVLKTPILVNKTSEDAFSSQNLVTEVFDSLDYYESEDQAYIERFESGTPDQATLTQIAAARYEMWDFYLNQIWRTLTIVKSEEEMAQIRAEERAWIKEKEAAMKEAGKEAEGGTMQPMLEQGAGSELTKQRVYELLEYLK